MAVSDRPVRTVRVLHLEDEAHDAEIIRHRLRAQGFSFHITWANGEQAFREALAGGAFDLVRADLNLQGYDGLAALALAQETQPGAPVSVISGAVSEGEAGERLAPPATEDGAKEPARASGAAVTRALREA